MTAPLSRAEIARPDTWISAIAAFLKPEDAAEDDGAELRFGSLCLSADGKWYRWSASKGGKGALSLIAHLRGCSELEAAVWARQWLSEHPGDGEALDSISDHDKAARRTANLERILTESVEDTSDTAAEAYLRSRGLEPPFPSSVRFLPDSRIGEHGTVFLLTDAADEVVGAQVVNIDPLGRKSTVAPVKQTFTGKPEPQAALRLTCGEPAEGAADLVVVEGLENALACWKAGVGRHIIGVPGSVGSRRWSCRRALTSSSFGTAKTRRTPRPQPRPEEHWRVGTWRACASVSPRRLWARMPMQCCWAAQRRG